MPSTEVSAWQTSGRIPKHQDIEPQIFGRIKQLELQCFASLPHSEMRMLERYFQMGSCKTLLLYRAPKSVPSPFLQDGSFCLCKPRAVFTKDLHLYSSRWTPPSLLPTSLVAVLHPEPPSTSSTGLTLQHCRSVRSASSACWSLFTPLHQRRYPSTSAPSQAYR